MKKKRVERRKKRINLREEYKESFKFIKETKPFLIIIIGLFFASLLIGFFIPAPDFIVQKISVFANEISSKIQGMSALEVIQFIIINNVQVSFFGMMLGIFFGIMPVIFSIVNGYVLGFILSISVQNAGLLSLWKIFPHGIFEIPAVFISLGIGLRFGSLIFKKKLKEFKSFFWDSARVFLLVVVPLLIIAGVIEGILVYFLR